MDEQPISIEEALMKKKRKWPTILVVLFVTLLVGGLTYYFVNKKATTDKNNLQTQIDDLNKKYSDSQTALATAQASIAAPTTSSTTLTTTTTPIVTMNKDIESVKFANLIKVNTAIGDALETPTYADLNGDNSEEALVVYRYSGSGNIADFYIYGMKNGSATKLFTKSTGGTIAIKNGSVYVDFRDPEAAVNVGKDNASMVLSHVKYTWNGTTFAESNQ